MIFFCRHRLFPLLKFMLEKCEQATANPSMFSSSATSVAVSSSSAHHPATATSTNNKLLTSKTSAHDHHQSSQQQQSHHARHNDRQSAPHAHDLLSNHAKPLQFEQELINFFKENESTLSDCSLPSTPELDELVSNYIQKIYYFYLLESSFYKYICLQLNR